MKPVTEAYTDISGVRHHDRALVLNPVLKSDRFRPINDDSVLEEIVGLAQAIDLDVAYAETLYLLRTVPATLFGKGQVENVAAVVKAQNIALAVVNHALSPVQQRNLERVLKCKVIDRTGLILEIFGARAQTKEGQLQVELAALNYQKSRLVRSWTHLERQRGGFGFMGGPGETQLEVDRRLITDRIARLKLELEQVRRRRHLQREARQSKELPTIALVGYTNAGKSTFFNRLTGAAADARNMLFATLDPTMRAMKLPDGREVVLSDTVGFISDLPTHLIEAFRATLEEVQQADVILHVRDIARADTKDQRDAVMAVLADLGIGADDERLIEVQNKIDLLPPEERELLETYARHISKESERAPSGDGLRSEAKGGVAGISAATGEGILTLIKLIEKRLAISRRAYDIEIDLANGAALSWLHERGNIIKRRNTKTKAHLKVELDAADYGRFKSRFLRRI